MGVYDKEQMWCTECNKETTHETGWESEEPDSLETKCLTCGKHVIKNVKTGTVTPVRAIEVRP